MNASKTYWLMVLWLVPLLVFSIYPALDLHVSSLFFDPARDGFYANQSHGLQIVREVFWNLANLTALGVAILGGLSLAYKKALRIPGRLWGYLLLIVILGPGLLVNGLLKAYWGRARPALVEDFGGTAQFTPPWQLTDQCTGNCSFVSGEASASMAFALIWGVVLWRLVPKNRRILLIGILALFVFVGSGLRVVMGRHFLSDVTWAGILTVSVAYGLGRAMQINDAIQSISRESILHDLSVIGTSIRRLFGKQQN